MGAHRGSVARRGRRGGRAVAKRERGASRGSARARVADGVAVKSGVESVQAVDARTVALPIRPTRARWTFLPSLAAPTAAGARTRAVVLIVAGPVQPVLLALLSLARHPRPRRGDVAK